MKKEEFIKLCAKSNLLLSNVQTQQFLDYAKLIKEYNEKINLTSIVELEEVLDKHFYDSLLPSFSYDFKGCLCDVGAGAGLPSIPLKIAYPDLEVVIIEPILKRVKFLNEVIKILDLKGIKCINARSEDYVKNHRESFDIVSARAVASLDILSELCIPLVKKGGIFLAMKGSKADEELVHSKNAYTVLGCELEKKESSFLNDKSTRNNLFFRKVKNTPKKYPRGYAQIKKNPL
ncbi:MAG: 16S rRNA (guanine(527)-N(7))-methyltransferase RsmG [Anaerorhabdus sp.]